MRKKPPIFAMLVAWLVAAGGQWELLQAFAWAKMFAGYAETMSLGDSLRATFEPENRCRYCALAEVAKEQQTDVPAVPSADSVAKFLLVLQPAVDDVIVAPAGTRCIVPESIFMSAGRAAPPTPPPRELVG
jgi:hypothetical protein